MCVCVYVYVYVCMCVCETVRIACDCAYTERPFSTLQGNECCGSGEALSDALYDAHSTMKDNWRDTDAYERALATTHLDRMVDILNCLSLHIQYCMCLK